MAEGLLADPIDALVPGALNAKQRRASILDAPKPDPEVIQVEADPIDDLITSSIDRGTALVTNNLLKTSDKSPEEHAKIRATGKALGVPEEIVGISPDTFDGRLLQRRMIDTLTERPKLLDYFKSPSAVKLAREDLIALGELHDRLQRFRAIEAGPETFLSNVGDKARSFAASAIRDFFGSSISGFGDLLESASKGIDAGLDALTPGEPSAELTAFRKAERITDVSSGLKAIGGQLERLGNFIDVPTYRKDFGDHVFGGVGQMAAVIISASRGNFSPGLAFFGIGAHMQTKRVEQAQERADILRRELQREGLDAGDLEDLDISDAQKGFAQFAGGTATAVSEMIGLSFILRKLPSAITKPLKTKFFDIAQSFGVEALQETVENGLHNVIAHIAYEPNAGIDALLTDPNLVNSIKAAQGVFAGAGHEALVAGTSAALVRSVLLTALGVRLRGGKFDPEAALKLQRESATQNAGAVWEAVDAVQNTTVAEVDSEEARAAVGALAADTEIEVVYFDPVALERYFDEVGEDSTLMFQLMGITEKDITDAHDRGSSVAVPLSTLSTITELNQHRAGLTPFMKLKYDGLSEADIDLVAKLEAGKSSSLLQAFLTGETIDEAVENDTSQDVFDTVFSDLVAAGRSQAEARVGALVTKNMFKVLGSKDIPGEDAASLYSRAVTGIESMTFEEFQALRTGINPVAAAAQVVATQNVQVFNQNLNAAISAIASGEQADLAAVSGSLDGVVDLLNKSDPANPLVGKALDEIAKFNQAVEDADQVAIEQQLNALNNLLNPQAVAAGARPSISGGPQQRREEAEVELFQQAQLDLSAFPSRKITVYRVGVAGTNLTGKNAGNVEGIISFLEMQDRRDFSYGDTITAFEVEVFGDTGDYAAFTGGGENVPHTVNPSGGRVGLDAVDNPDWQKKWFSFPEGGAWRITKTLGKVSIKDLDAQTAALGKDDGFGGTHTKLLTLSFVDQRRVIQEAFALPDGELIDTADNKPPDPTDIFIQSQSGMTFDQVFENADLDTAALHAILSRVAEETGAEPLLVLAKKRDDVEAKFKRKVYTDTAQMTDIIRSGIVFEGREGTGAVVEALLDTFGVENVLDEGWKINPAFYFDRKVLVRFENGVIGEVQIRTREIHQAKIPVKEGGLGGEDLYNEWRKLPNTDPNKLILERQMKELYASAVSRSDADVLGMFLRSEFGNALEKLLDDIGVPLSITSDLLTLTQPLSLDTTAYASPDLISAAGRLSQSTNISILSDILGTSIDPVTGEVNEVLIDPLETTTVWHEATVRGENEETGEVTEVTAIEAFTVIKKRREDAEELLDCVRTS